MMILEFEWLLVHLILSLLFNKTKVDEKSWNKNGTKNILAACDKSGDSTKFIEFMLRALLETSVGVSVGVKSLDEQIFHLLESSEIPLRANNMAMQLNASPRTVERAIQRLKKRAKVSSPNFMEILLKTSL